MTIDECRIKAKEMVDGIIFSRASWRILAELSDVYDIDGRAITVLWVSLNKPDLRDKANYKMFVEALKIAQGVKKC